MPGDDPSAIGPADFHFSIGGCFGGYCKLEISKKGLVYQPAGCFDSGEILVMPSQRKWQNFYKKLAEAKVDSWKHYFNDPDILDGTQWEFRLKTADLKIETGGSNPPTHISLGLPHQTDLD